MVVFFRSLILLGICYAYSALLFLFSLTLGVFFRKGRDFLRQTCLYFGFGFPTGKEVARLPVVPIEEIIANNRFEVYEAAGKPGNISLCEIAVINSLVKTFNPSHLFEFGTFDGRTTMNMAINSSSEAKIYTLDLPAEGIDSVKLNLVGGDRQYILKNESGGRFLSKSTEGFPEKSKITQLYGDSASFDYRPYLNSIDFVFVDGSHSYEYVMNDSRAALDLLRGGKGIIAWHDYGGVWQGVTKALNQLKRMHPDLNISLIQGTSLVVLVKR